MTRANLYSSFSKKNVDSNLLHKTVKAEADAIFARLDGRTYDQVYTNVELGQIPERYMIEEFGWKNNPKKYHDVISTNGTEVEIKVLEEKYCNDYFIFTDPYDKNMNQWMNNKYNDKRKN